MNAIEILKLLKPTYITEVKTTLSGKEITKLMKVHKKTIKSLADEMGVTQIRVREVRSDGVHGRYMCYDWLEAITGEKPAWDLRK